MHRSLDYLLKGFLVVLLLTGTAGSLEAGAQTPELEGMMQTLGPDEEIRVIIQFSQRPDIQMLRHEPAPQRRSLAARELKRAAEHAQRNVKLLMEKRGVKDIVDLWMTNSLAVKAPVEVIRDVASHPDVQSVRPDRRISEEEILLQDLAPPERNIEAINADHLWAQGNLGQGAVVALMDTGADVNHPDLADSWRGGTNSWFDPFGRYLEPHDDNGHGTAVLGVIVGTDKGGSTIGVAPAAKWIAAAMFDDAGFTFISVLHQVFQWFLDPDGNPATDDAPDVVNASWGFDSFPGLCDSTFALDIGMLNAAGIAVVFAAGNSGPREATSISPANNPGAVAVGAVDEFNVIEPSSARGPSACDGRVYPDVVAPGRLIKTADLSFGGSAFYIRVTGTSFSAAHASGVLALLRSAFPDATMEELKGALLGQAMDLGTIGGDNVYGNGLVDAAAAHDSLGAFCIRPQVNFYATPFPASPNQAITFGSDVSGGTQPYSYAWDFDGDGVTDCDAAVCTHTYSEPFSGSVALTVTDANRCSSSVVIADGWAACVPISAGFSVSPSAPLTGQSVTFTSSVAGGTGPYTYEWDLNGDGGTDCTTAVCTTTYSAAFQGSVVLKVSDRYGCGADVYSAPISVAAAPAPSGGGGGGGCFVSAATLQVPRFLLGSLLACAMMGVGLVTARKRRREQKKDSLSF
jgi:serine protease AprX